MSDYRNGNTDALIIKVLRQADYVSTHEAMLSRTLARIASKRDHGVQAPDELWIVDHNDVYTLGQASKKEHILTRTETPIIQTDRGGQVTWHGRGQLVVYWLFDLERLGWSVRQLVSHAEQALEDVLNDLMSSISQDTAAPLSESHHCGASSRVSARARRDAPGVYLYAQPGGNSIDQRPFTQRIDSTQNASDSVLLGKIASLGFKIKRGFSYHGIALNVTCDLSAFNAINPCGYAGMQMLRLADFIPMSLGAPPTQHSPTYSYEQVTQRLIDNIAARHAGTIALRPLAATPSNDVSSPQVTQVTLVTGLMR